MVGEWFDAGRPARARQKIRIATSKLSRFVNRPLFVVFTVFIVVILSSVADR
jgi:hypothetical protein